MRLHRFVTLLLVCLALTLSLPFGCDQREEQSNLPGVVVSVLPQRYFVNRIAGDWVDVEVMIPPGATPATHEPTMRQLQAIGRSRVYVKVGHPNFAFEITWLDRLIERNPDLRVVDGSEGQTYRQGDPHVWVSPDCARQMARNIADALIPVLPQHQIDMEQNLQAFLEDIDELDAYIRQALSDLDTRRFIVFHPAWGYFAEQYGLEQVAVEEGPYGTSPAALARLIDRARAEDVGVIFVQPQFSRQQAEALARELGAEVLSIDPLAEDWLSNMYSVADAFRGALSQ